MASVETTSHAARRVVVEALVRVEQDNAYSHVVFDHLLRTTPLSDPDRRLATRIFYGTLAMQRHLDAWLSRPVGDLEQRTEPWVRATLRAAVYQLLFLDRTPTHAVVHSAVELVKAQRGRGAAGFTNAVLRAIVKQREAGLPVPTDPVVRFGVQHSLPDAMAETVLARFGEEEASRWAEAVNAPPNLTARVNLSRVSMEEALREWQAEPGALAPAAITLPTLNPALRQATDAGSCAIQDEGSQVVVHCLEPLPLGGSVWDACAGQGGKTMHLLDLLAPDPTTRVWATDLHHRKLERLRKRLNKVFPRATLNTKALDLGQQGLNWPSEPFDAVLLDAPCSGLGVIRRHPETRWRRDLPTIEALAALQHVALRNVAAAVKVGGLLVYAVCTNTAQESVAQVESFLQDCPDFRLESSPLPWLMALESAPGLVELLPHRHGCDGFFIARMRRQS